MLEAVLEVLLEAVLEVLLEAWWLLLPLLLVELLVVIWPIFIMRSCMKQFCLTCCWAHCSRRFFLILAQMGTGQLSSLQLLAWE